MAPGAESRRASQHRATLTDPPPASHVAFATARDLPWAIAADRHLSAAQLREKIQRQEIVISRLGGRPIGYLRYSLFWDMVPFINLLFIDAAQRGRGHGARLVHGWEELMKAKGHQQAMTSSQSDETAQRFYRKIGYRDIGHFDFPGQAPELLFLKTLDLNVAKAFKGVTANRAIEERSDQT